MMCLTLENFLENFSGLAMLVVSTCFWESPMKQCKNMLMGGKIFATIIFFLICAALVAIVLVPATSQVEAVFKVPAMCFLMVVQAIVFIWYLLATIPSAFAFVFSCFMCVCVCGRASERV